MSIWPYYRRRNFPESIHWCNYFHILKNLPLIASQRKGICIRIVVCAHPKLGACCVVKVHFALTFLEQHSSTPLNNGKDRTPPLKQANFRTMRDSTRTIWDSLNLERLKPQGTTALTLLPSGPLVWKMRMTLCSVHHQVCKRTWTYSVNDKAT